MGGIYGTGCYCRCFGVFGKLIYGTPVHISVLVAGHKETHQDIMVWFEWIIDPGLLTVVMALHPFVICHKASDINLGPNGVIYGTTIRVLVILGGRMAIMFTYIYIYIYIYTYTGLHI